MDKKIITVQTSNLPNAIIDFIIQLLHNEFDDYLLRKNNSQLLAFKHSDYMISYIDNIGFSLWWNFEDFIFIEYIVILEKYRNQGYGSIILGAIKDYGKLIILEVETDSQLKKFYEINNFFSCHTPYSPIQINEKPQASLSLMSHNHELSQAEFEIFFNKISSDELQF